MKYIFILFISLFFPACMEKTEEKNIETLKIEKDLKVAFGYKPRSFDPHRHTDSSTLAVTKQIYNNLFALTEDGELISELVESYEIQRGQLNYFKFKKRYIFP